MFSMATFLTITNEFAFPKCIGHKRCPAGTCILKYCFPRAWIERPSGKTCIKTYMKICSGILSPPLKNCSAFFNTF